VISRDELRETLWQSRKRKCSCRQYKRSSDCEHLLWERHRVDRDTALLSLLVDLRDLIAEATLVRTLIVDQLVAEGWRSPPLSDEEIERRMAKRRAERAGAK
jgi:hypothetical protein